MYLCVYVIHVCDLGICSSDCSALLSNVRNKQRSADMSGEKNRLHVCVVYSSLYMCVYRKEWKTYLSSCIIPMFMDACVWWCGCDWWLDNYRAIVSMTKRWWLGDFCLALWCWVLGGCVCLVLRWVYFVKEIVPILFKSNGALKIGQSKHQSIILKL